MFSGSTESGLKNALVFLGLTTPDYQPAPQLERLVTVSDEERRNLLSALVRQRYGPLLTGIDLTRTTRGELKEAFLRAGSKGETADKAVSFFVSFAQSGGVAIHEQLRTRKPAKRAPRAPKERKTIFPKSIAEGQTTEDTEQHRTEKDIKGQDNFRRNEDMSLHPALQGVLGHLPREGKRWTSREKEVFSRALSAILDLAYPTVEEAQGRET